MTASDAPHPIENYEFIRQTAERLAFSGDLRILPDLEPFLARLGGRVERLPADSWESDQTCLVEVRGPLSFTVTLPTRESIMDRFFISIALGHYFLHAIEGTRPGRFMQRSKSDMSTEAVWFALSLLIPGAASGLADAVAAAKYGVNEQTIALWRKFASKFSADATTG